ncbi:MAG: nucleoside:proton symporter [Euryhalocaulis sp.]|uniref:NupC/NupG family nucleoside CNT transporter n=1 Tax=Euryhalocaulis sp. TaxID=2744307 RepID=UPI0017C79A67|nr:nucleoside transporter C-terminal domain-containing protein [Euryhalocaulis sp.]MBA4802099.1 nucleoside:proton symporter [Euryhalocaulis sp.]
MEQSWGVDNARAILGLLLIIIFAWGWGGFRRPSMRMILWALGLQFGLVLLLFAAPALRGALVGLNSVVDALEGATRAGTAFVFGYVGGGATPYDTTKPQNSVSLAFQVLPLVLLVSALSAVLWRWRVLPFVTGLFAAIFRRTLGLSGAASLAVAANIFLGMVEAPILAKPYLSRLTRSELFVIMTAGMATVAGTVLIIYAILLRPLIPEAVGHVLAASVISVPAAVLLARLMVPEDDPRGAAKEARAERLHIGEPVYDSTMDALTTGVVEGMKLYLNILAMLIVFVALVALANVALGAAPDVAGAPLSVERIFGWAFQPLMWLMGIPWAEAQTAGGLFGVKTALNEFLAFERLGDVSETLSPRTRLILTYALCGFANFGSLGIMLAGLTTMAPNRRKDILDLGLPSLVSGTLATVMTGCVIAALPAGMFGF